MLDLSLLVLMLAASGPAGPQTPNFRNFRVPPGGLTAPRPDVRVYERKKPEGDSLWLSSPASNRRLALLRPSPQSPDRCTVPMAVGRPGVRPTRMPRVRPGVPEPMPNVVPEGACRPGEPKGRPGR